MSRIIDTDSAGKRRTKLVRAIVLAVRELTKLSRFNEEARDCAAFIAIALAAISEGIDESVAAWEKRGYWIKADRFRMEWSWTQSASDQLKEAVRAGDIQAVAGVTAKIAVKLGNVQVTEHARVGKPWQGAYKRLNSNS